MFFYFDLGFNRISVPNCVFLNPNEIILLFYYLFIMLVPQFWACASKATRSNSSSSMLSNSN